MLKKMVEVVLHNVLKIGFPASLFWQLIVADCDYAESYGWFLSGENAYVPL